MVSIGGSLMLVACFLGFRVPWFFTESSLQAVRRYLLWLQGHIPVSGVNSQCSMEITLQTNFWWSPSWWQGDRTSSGTSLNDTQARIKNEFSSYSEALWDFLLHSYLCAFPAISPSPWSRQHNFPYVHKVLPEGGGRANPLFCGFFQCS